MSKRDMKIRHHEGEEWIRRRLAKLYQDGMRDKGVHPRNLVVIVGNQELAQISREFVTYRKDRLRKTLCGVWVVHEPEVDTAWVISTWSRLQRDREQLYKVWGVEGTPAVEDIQAMRERNLLEGSGLMVELLEEIKRAGVSGFNEDFLDDIDNVLAVACGHKEG